MNKFCLFHAFAYILCYLMDTCVRIKLCQGGGFDKKCIKLQLLNESKIDKEKAALLQLFVNRVWMFRSSLRGTSPVYA